MSDFPRIGGDTLLLFSQAHLSGGLQYSDLPTWWVSWFPRYFAPSFIVPKYRYRLDSNLNHSCCNHCVVCGSRMAHKSQFSFISNTSLKQSSHDFGLKCQFQKLEIDDSSLTAVWRKNVRAHLMISQSGFISSLDSCSLLLDIRSKCSVIAVQMSDYVSDTYIVLIIVIPVQQLEIMIW